MKALLRWLALILAAVLGLQLFFVGRIALMSVVDPKSTTFERSEAWRIRQEKGSLRWRQQWMAYDDIPTISSGPSSP
jgi:monofunctional biosynthetic peptidoglycan transglycosylase